jgi:hypothetical protein
MTPTRLALGFIHEKRRRAFIPDPRIGTCGLIGKRTNSRYEAGKRTGAWVKIKLHKDQEFVIGGYTEPKGSRKHFGALLVGFYEGKNLKFAGRAGTGFSEKLLRSLFDDLQKIRVESCPFSDLRAPGRSRRDQGLTAAEMKRCRWVKPSMVCQVKFTEWTRDDRLRQPVFLELGKIKIRTKWFGRRRTKDLNDRSAKVAFSPTRVIHKQCRDKRKLFGSGKNFEAKKELLRPGFGQRSHFGEKRLASRAAPIAPIQEARREGALVTGPPDSRFPAHIAERFTLIGICQLLGVVCKASQFQAQFAMREETNNDRFFATAGRTAKELGQGQKLS